MSDAAYGPPKRHRRYVEFKNKHPSREDVRDMLQLYDDRRVGLLEDRIAWLELPWWGRAWRTVKAWWETRTGGEA